MDNPWIGPASIYLYPVGGGLFSTGNRKFKFFEDWEGTSPLDNWTGYTYEGALSPILSTLQSYSGTRSLLISGGGSTNPDALVYNERSFLNVSIQAQVYMSSAASNPMLGGFVLRHQDTGGAGTFYEIILQNSGIGRVYLFHHSVEAVKTVLVDTFVAFDKNVFNLWRAKIKGTGDSINIIVELFDGGWTEVINYIPTSSYQIDNEGGVGLFSWSGAHSAIFTDDVYIREL